MSFPPVIDILPFLHVAPTSLTEDEVKQNLLSVPDLATRNEEAAQELVMDTFASCKDEMLDRYVETGLSVVPEVKAGVAGELLMTMFRAAGENVVQINKIAEVALAVPVLDSRDRDAVTLLFWHMLELDKELSDPLKAKLIERIAAIGEATKNDPEKWAFDDLTRDRLVKYRARYAAKELQ